MTRVTKRRHRNPPQNTSPPAIFGIDSTNMTIKVLSLATDLDSLTRATDPPMTLSSPRDAMMPSDSIDHSPYPAMVTSSFPNFMPFYAPDARVSSIVTGGDLYYPGVAMAAASSVTEITTSTGDGIVVLASPLSAGSSPSVFSTASVATSLTSTSLSVSQTPFPVSTESSETAVVTVTNAAPTASITSKQSSTKSSSVHNSTFTGCTYNINMCLPDYPGKHVGPRFHFWGLTIGLPASIMFVLILWFLLWKFKYCKAARRGDSSRPLSRWHKITGFGRTTHTNTDSTSETQQVALSKKSHDFGEPGPAFDFYGKGAEGRRISVDNVPIPKNKRTSNTIWYGRPIDPFGSTASTTTGNQFTDSKIGIALTRYSTAESTLPLPKPLSPRKEHKIYNDYGTNFNEGHHRHSSTSISSDATTRFDPQVTPLQTATIARRHSLTPRIINIVAAGSSSDRVSGGENKENNKSPGFHDNGRNSFRSRSMSPSKLLSGYASFINEIPARRPESRPHIPTISQGSNDHSDSSASTKASAIDMTRYPDIPDRGRSMKRTAEAHISFPPTSYPNLGRTMADVKKTIREKGGAAFASTDDLRVRARRSGTDSIVAELPSSVTVTRGRGG